MEDKGGSNNSAALWAAQRTTATAWGTHLTGVTPVTEMPIAKLAQAHATAVPSHPPVCGVVHSQVVHERSHSLQRRHTGEGKRTQQPPSHQSVVHNGSSSSSSSCVDEDQIVQYTADCQRSTHSSCASDKHMEQPRRLTLRKLVPSDYLNMATLHTCTAQPWLHPPQPPLLLPAGRCRRRCPLHHPHSGARCRWGPRRCCRCCCS